MEKNELVLLYGTHYKEMTKALLAFCDLQALIGDRGKKIAIKPNLLGQILPEEGATTHLEVTAGLIEYLQEEGFADISVMESAWVGDSTQETIRYTGYDVMLAKYEVPFVDLQQDRGVPTDCAGMPLQICSRALDADFLINVPVLKGHCQTKVTCALKNMKGVIPAAEKRRFHRMGLHEPIAHLSAGIHQDFILVDSICGDLTMEDGGDPVTQNRLAAALDPVLVDAWGCSVIGIEPSQVPYIGIAESLGVGSADLAGAKVTVLREEQAASEDPAENKTGLSYVVSDEDPLPPNTAGGFRRIMELSELADAVDSCSACYAYLIPALEMLEKEGLLPRLKERVCIGQGWRGKSGELGVGNCTRMFRHTLAGCPPLEGQMAEFLRNYILGQTKEKKGGGQPH